MLGIPAYSEEEIAAIWWLSRRLDFLLLGLGAAYLLAYMLLPSSFYGKQSC
jgi:hypothetical protein